MGDYEFKVRWCKVCEQGWVEIVKDKKMKTYCFNVLSVCHNGMVSMNYLMIYLKKMR